MVVLSIKLLYFYFVLNMFYLFIELAISGFSNNGFVIINFNKYNEMLIELIIMIIGFVATVFTMSFILINYMKRKI